MVSVPLASIIVLAAAAAAAAFVVSAFGNLS